jgi:hypothetical protein
MYDTYTEYMKVNSPEAKIAKLEARKVNPESTITEAERADVSTKLQAGLTALNNWGSLTAAQKDIVLKNILKYILWKEGLL